MFQAVKNKKIEEHFIKRYLTLILSLLLAAITFNLFVKPTKIITGGTNGIAIILNYLFNFNTTIIIIVLAVVIIILSLIFLGYKNTSSIFIATFLYPIFVSLTANICKYISLNYADKNLVCLLIGLLSGISNGLVLKEGFSNGGLIVISQIIYKYFKISISKMNFIINFIIVVIGGFYFGINNIMYAVIILYINTVILDKILLGTSRCKNFYIITNKTDDISKFIALELRHGVTLFKVRGGLLKKPKQALMVCLPMKDYFILTETIKEIDPKAFFIATDSYEQKGGM